MSACKKNLGPEVLAAWCLRFDWDGCQSVIALNMLETELNRVDNP